MQIDYAKYENMDKNSLFDALEDAKKEYETIKKQADNQKKLVVFLQEKVKDKTHMNGLDEAIKEFENGETFLYADYDEYKAKIDE